MPVLFKLTSFGHSDIGLVRRNNEDVFLQLAQHQFYILADGMGGHKAGEIAAQETAVFLCDCIDKMFKKALQPLSLASIQDCLHTFIHRSNERIYSLGQENHAYHGMGTTLCSMLFYDQTLIYAHVGDSRIYRFRNKTLTPLTKDHTLKNKLIEQGQLEHVIQSGMRYKNILTRAIGAFKTISPDIGHISVLPDDLYIMCSDGLSDYVSDEEISSLLDQDKSLEQLTFDLINTAKRKGSCDNITVLITYVHPNYQ